MSTSSSSDSSSSNFLRLSSSSSNDDSVFSSSDTSSVFSISDSVNSLAVDLRQRALILIDQLWYQAETKIKKINKSKHVTPQELTDIGLDANSLKDAVACIGRIDKFLVTRKYEEAISLLRGCRLFFQKSRITNIQLLFNDMEELEKLRDIYIVLRRSNHFGIDAAMALCT